LATWDFNRQAVPLGWGDRPRRYAAAVTETRAREPSLGDLAASSPGAIAA